MKRFIKANAQEIRNEIQRLEEALKEAEKKRSKLDELNSQVSELFNTVSDARNIEYSPNISKIYDNAILDIKDDIQELKEKLIKEENFIEYVALKWDDFIQELKQKVMQFDNEFSKLGSKYNIPIPSNTFINEMKNYSKEYIKKIIDIKTVNNVITFCKFKLFNGDFEYYWNLKNSWDMDISLNIYDESFPPRWSYFTLDGETIYYDDDIENKELFDSLPDEYQKKIIDFTNEYKQFNEKVNNEYCDFIENYFS